MYFFVRYFDEKSNNIFIILCSSRRSSASQMCGCIVCSCLFANTYKKMCAKLVNTRLYSQRNDVLLFKKMQFEICDALGQLIYSSLFPDSSSHTVTIDLSEQPKGMYFVKLNTEKGIVVRKLVVE